MADHMNEFRRLAGLPQVESKFKPGDKVHVTLPSGSKKLKAKPSEHVFHVVDHDSETGAVKIKHPITGAISAVHPNRLSHAKTESVDSKCPHGAKDSKHCAICKNFAHAAAQTAKRHKAAKGYPTCLNCGRPAPKGKKFCTGKCRDEYKLGDQQDESTEHMDEGKALPVGSKRTWGDREVMKTRQGWVDAPSVTHTPAATASVAAPAQAPAKHSSILDKAKHLGGHALHMAVDPFKKGYQLVTDKKYRGEVKDYFVGAIKHEASQTTGMVKTIGKAIRGQKVTKEERNAAINQFVDLAKVALIAGFAGHEMADGFLKFLAAAASPADEIAGMLLDKPLRAATQKVFGIAHGILPSSFYEADEAEHVLLLKLFDAVLDEMNKAGLDSSEVESILSQKLKSAAKAESRIESHEFRRLAGLLED